MPEDREENEEEILDISAEDLQEPFPSVESDQGEILVIESEDLDEVPHMAPLAPTGQSYSPVDETFVGPKAKKGLLAGGLVGSVVLQMGLAGGLVGSVVLQMGLAGGLGGFLAWLMQEPFITDGRAGSTARMLLEMAGFGAGLGGVIGLALGSVEGIASRVWEKTLIGGLLGLAIGGVGGAFGGLLGQVVYGTMGGGALGGNLILQIAIRAFAWAVVGLFVGLGQGVMMRASQKIVNGLIGGAVGGFLGGFLFDPLAVIVTVTTQITGTAIQGELSRMVGMTVMGICAGVAIGMVEEMRKEAWLTIVAGPLTGKQFIIYRSPTTIGSSPKADISLAKDTAVAPQHASIEIDGNGYVLSDLSGGGTLINGRPITRQVLRDGDNIQIGRTVLQYSVRSAPVQPGSQTVPY